MILFEDMKMAIEEVKKLDTHLKTNAMDLSSCTASGEHDHAQFVLWNDAGAPETWEPEWPQEWPQEETWPQEEQWNEGDIQKLAAMQQQAYQAQANLDAFQKGKGGKQGKDKSKGKDGRGKG